MDSLELTELNSLNAHEEDEERNGRMRRLLIILLLLLLLLFGVILAYLAMYGKLFDREEAPGINVLFSLFGFDRPLAVSTDKAGRVFVSDTGNRRIVIFNSEGDYIRTIRGVKKADRFGGAIGTYYDDKEKKLYVAEFRRRKISVFNERGKRIARFPPNPATRDYGPLAFSPFAISEYQNKLYVTSNDGIYVFSKKGKLLKQWSGNGTDLGQFDYPIALEIDDADGTMYVADQLNRRVFAMTQKGVVKWVLGRADMNGAAASFFGLPRGIAIDPQGRVFVSDTFHHELVVLSKDGKLLGTVANRGVEDAALNFPEEITFRSDGALYLADRENDRVQAWRISKLKNPTAKLRQSYKRYYYRPEG